jgi:hypothetical protein
MEQIASLGVRLWVAGVLILAFAAHPVVDRLTDPFARGRHAIYEHSAAGSVVVMRLRDKRLVHPIFGERQRFYFEHLTPEIFDRLLTRHGTITVVLRESRVGWHLRRQAQETLRRQALENPKILSALTSRAEFELLFDGGEDTSERLRIWRVSTPTLDNNRHRSSSSTTPGAGRVGRLFRQPKHLVEQDRDSKVDPEADAGDDAKTYEAATHA